MAERSIFSILSRTRAGGAWAVKNTANHKRQWDEEYLDTGTALSTCSLKSPGYTKTLIKQPKAGLEAWIQKIVGYKK